MAHSKGHASCHHTRPSSRRFDENYGQKHCGSYALFAAVAEARPRIHCFGHIHEAWGARLVTWRTTPSQVDILPSHLTHIDNERSKVIESMRALRPLRPGNFESAAGWTECSALDGKIAKLQACKKQGAYTTSVSSEDGAPLRVGEQTLFVNAAIKGTFELPWVIDIDLPRAKSLEEKEAVPKEAGEPCHGSTSAANRSTIHSSGTESSSADFDSIDNGQGAPQPIQPDPLTDVKLALDKLCLSPRTNTSPPRPPCLRPSASGDEQGLS
ncbi:hypothetical protein F5X68DRAFT_200945 [Plectosphaerella plurivora]|uniref:Uncharacterized protein n=1 Tax=Plectosphaerella plurivora TaxID=936078 RepID=A0A9P8VI26_9PEZI|nr:hypothetical protein F5X68DRAFT_200945 [Plectosphaerella plurivora]